VVWFGYEKKIHIERVYCLAPARFSNINRRCYRYWVHRPVRGHDCNAMNTEIITYPKWEWSVQNTKVFMLFAYEDAFENLCEEYCQLEFKHQIRNMI
jgi:hypothetical protein